MRFCKRTCCALSAVAAAAVLGGQPAAAAPADACREPPRTIALEGLSEVKAQPDVAYVRVSVERKAKTAGEARRLAEQAVSAFAEGLKTGKNTGPLFEKDDAFLRAESISVRPEYFYENRSNERKLSGYLGTRAAVVRLKNFDLISEVLDAAMKAGINAVSDVYYEVEDPKPVKERARREAVSDAMAKAAQIAETLGVKLGRVRSVTYGAGRDGFEPRPYRAVSNMRAMAVAADTVAGSAEEGGVYAPDSLKFTDSVSVVFTIE